MRSGKSLKIILPFLLTSFLLSVFSITCFAGPQEKKLVGGPCQYKSYPGQATIISIQRSTSIEHARNKGFEVKFSFTPKNKIAEGFVQTEGKTFILYDKNSQYPDKEFLSKNNLQVGKPLDANLQAIVSGTCTPVVFDFPSLKQ
ncbi:MAG TPA: hypothetical protein PKZ12_01270 [Smithellaceae bacterium]|nr:hypothetical protein [Smithellaceae bacterium]